MERVARNHTAVYFNLTRGDAEYGSPSVQWGFRIRHFPIAWLLRTSSSSVSNRRWWSVSLLLVSRTISRAFLVLTGPNYQERNRYLFLKCSQEPTPVISSQLGFFLKLLRETLWWWSCSNVFINRLSMPQSLVILTRMPKLRWLRSTIKQFLPTNRKEILQLDLKREPTPSRIDYSFDEYSIDEEPEARSGVFSRPKGRAFKSI